MSAIEFKRYRDGALYVRVHERLSLQSSPVWRLLSDAYEFYRLRRRQDMKPIALFRATRYFEPDHGRCWVLTLSKGEVRVK